MANSRNPYTPPAAPVADPLEQPKLDAGETFIPNGRQVRAGQGAAWIGDAWRLLRARPGKWLLAMLLLIVAPLAAVWIPFANVVTPLLWPFARGALMMAADAQRRTGTFELSTLLEGFRRQPLSLLAVGALSMLTLAALFVSLAVMIGTDAATGAMLSSNGRLDSRLMLSPNYSLAILISLALSLPIIAATYFATPLIMLNGLPAGTAMKMSFVASFKNVLAGLTFSLCAMGLLLGSIVSFGIGFLVSLPILILTNYTMYRDLFIEKRTE